MPRKKSEDFYRTHGFTANLSNGKYSATCHYCDRVLQNTALSRLSLHRQTCDQRRGRYTEPIQNKSDEADSYDEPLIKIQKISSAEDVDFDNAPEGKEIIVKIQQILDAADEESGEKRPTIIKSEILQQSNTKGLNQGQNVEIHISNEDESAHEFFELVNDNNKEHYIIPENLDDGVQEAATIVARPKSNLASLRAEKARAEIKQFQSKTKFLKTETENLKLVRTLTLLKIQKLRLEIDALRAQN
ncbi:uncharacterized protein Dana_GF16586, isoform A [Drosophila ananassae]|uniref:Uncharacterized protein, isoform A n=1 Tax=Drosophila ananassae TaxID=7217 RepID=B3M1L4_DROAN|nr:uncharacterized protein LOC6499382 isoform X2 [Drosophila ananassae]EDV43305.1 uncharacterized protein Dana_GF16586, isoform A [Drosophila ananassae]